MKESQKRKEQNQNKEIQDLCHHGNAEVIPNSSLESRNTKSFAEKIFFAQIMVTEEVEKEKRVLAGEEQRRVISLQVMIKIAIRRIVMRRVVIRGDVLNIVMRRIVIRKSR